VDIYRKGTPCADHISCSAYGKRDATLYPKYGRHYKWQHVQLNTNEGYVSSASVSPVDWMGM